MVDDIFDSPEAKRGALLRLAGVAGVVALLTVGLKLAVPSAADPAWVREALASLGGYAPLVFIALQAVQVMVAPIPGQVLGGVAGYLFGGVTGTVYSMTGVLLGSAVVFGLTRRYGRAYAESVVTAEAMESWDAFVRRTGTVGLFALFVLPTFPDDLLCFVAGLSDIRFRTFLVLVGVGRTPSFVLVAYTGTSVAEGEIALAVALLVGLTLVSTLLHVYRARLLEALGGEH